MDVNKHTCPNRGGTSGIDALSAFIRYISRGVMSFSIRFRGILAPREYPFCTMNLW